MKGRLSVVSTPIGNRDDITLRAIETLKTSDVILAEDTRETGRLLNLLGIPKKKLISYREQNHDRVYSNVLRHIKIGQMVALVSDRGTPGISDPGYRLVRALQDDGVEIVSVPGPSALTAAVSISGLSTGRITFLGFLPRSSRKQRKILQQASELTSTIVIYESPLRVGKLLKLLAEEFPQAEVSLAHELTKKHEEVIRGNIHEISEALNGKKLKGEWVVMIRPVQQAGHL